MFVDKVNMIPKLPLQKSLFHYRKTGFNTGMERVILHFSKISKYLSILGILSAM